MDTRTVAVLKFVGTVSVGLLTGLSYSLSAVSTPALLTLPTAALASRPLAALEATGRVYQRALGLLSGASFLLAFVLSPRASRHPYLLYSSALVAASRLSSLTARLFSPAPSAKAHFAAAKHDRKQERAARRMEASYELLGQEAHSDGGSGSGNDDHADHDPDTAAADANGEDVRQRVDTYVRKQMAAAATAGLGFVLAVVGIWGDGVQ